MIVAVFGVARLAAGTLAESFELLTNVVVNVVPFQFTVEPDTNPNPVTVSVYPEAPGAADEGVIGYSTGTGLAALAATGIPSAATAKNPTRPLRISLRFISHSFQAFLSSVPQDVRPPAADVFGLIESAAPPIHRSVHS